MTKDPNILKEIQEISPLLASVHGMNVYRVPEGYFDRFFDDVLDAITIKHIPGLEKSSVQNVPDGYFENLSSNIMQRIKAETMDEENELVSYPALRLEGKHNVFEVPTGYFEELPEKILGRIHGLGSTKVIPLFAPKIWRYAAAAVIAVGLFTASYFVINNQKGHANGFAIVNKNTVPNEHALKYNSTRAFNEGIASLSEDEIINYLEVHGNILDNDLLLKNTDVSGLPDAADYLINEEALTNYLDKINDKGSEKQ